MILQWGSYNFPINAAEVVIDPQDRLDEAQNAWGVDKHWRVRVFMDNPTASPSTMATMLARMEQAFESNGRDLRLLLNNGTPSHHVLLNSECIGGTRVIKHPSYPDGKGFQYGTFRTVEFEIAGLVPVSNRSALTSWVESIRAQGGGPRFGHLEPLVGFPIKQLLKQNTIWRAVQQGSAFGRDGYPIAPLPLWPDALIEPEGDPIELTAPTRIGDSFVNYGINWQYNYEAAQPHFGVPNAWTN